MAPLSDPSYTLHYLDYNPKYHNDHYHSDYTNHNFTTLINNHDNFLFITSHLNNHHFNLDH